MGKNERLFRILIFLLIILIMGSPIIFNKNSLATSPVVPYVKIHCNFNLTYINENLCEDSDCSPMIRKDDYSYCITDKENLKTSFSSIYIDEGVIWFNLDYVRFNNETVYQVYITENITDFLIQACEPDVTPVLDYLKENNFTADYNHFYAYKPSGENVKKINDKWYLEYSSFSLRKTDFVDYVYGFLICSFLTPIVLAEFLGVILAFSLFDTLIFLVLIGFFLILIYFNKDSKNKIIYFIPILLGLLGGIAGSVLFYRKYKDRKKSLKIFFIGLIVSLILYLYFVFLIISV